MLNIKRTEEKQIKWNELQVGDKFELNGIGFVVIRRDEDTAVIQQYDNLKYHVFNRSGSNAYDGSDLQKYINGEYKDMLTGDLYNRIDGELFILSEDDYDPVKTKYPYYKDIRNRTKYDTDGNAAWYWTSSPDASYANSVRIVYPTGHLDHNGAYYTHGVAPACRIILNP